MVSRRLGWSMVCLSFAAGLTAASLAYGYEGEQVLFDGTSLEGWRSSGGGAARWAVRDGYMEIQPGRGDIETVGTFGDFKLHLEFWLPYQPTRHGQERSNSGVYLQGRYELQILDSYDNDTYANGMCGAIYGQIAPSTNASLPPETWQTYDVTLRQPRVDQSGAVVETGRITVLLNGVTVIDDAEIDRPTAGGDERVGTPGPIRLQDHGNRIRFRNIRLESL